MADNMKKALSEDELIKVSGGLQCASANTNGEIFESENGGGTDDMRTCKLCGKYAKHIEYSGGRLYCTACSGVYFG